MLSPDLGILGRRQAESPLSTLFKFPEPPLTDIDLSMDDRFLYVACWGTGEM